MATASLAALAALDIVRGSARAQEATVDDVVVGARTEGLTRQGEKVLLRTPRSTAIVNGAKAEEEHLERLSDLSQLIPNYRPNIATARTSTPAIRGVGRGAGNGDSSELDTGFIVDNVFWKHVGFQWGDFTDLDAGVVGRAIDDLSAAVINTDWALKSGLKLGEDRIAQEPLADNPYRNFIAVKSGHENDPWVGTLVGAYQNDVVKGALASIFHGAGVPAW